MQTQSAVEEIRQRLSGIADIYNRLVLLVEPFGSGKTASLRALADAEKVPVNVFGAWQEQTISARQKWPARRTRFALGQEKWRAMSSTPKAVRFVVPSSAPQARNLLSSRQRGG